MKDLTHETPLSETSSSSLLTSCLLISYLLPPPPGTPLAAGHLGAAGVRREARQHGDPGARGSERHRLLRVPLPGGLQDAKAAHSHTA